MFCTIFIHELSCIGNLNRSLRSIFRFLILLNSCDFYIHNVSFVGMVSGKLRYKYFVFLCLMMT